MKNKDSSLGMLIDSELDNLLKQVELDVKQKVSIKKYLSKIKKAFADSNNLGISRLLSSDTKLQLLASYPMAKELMDNISIDVNRYSAQKFASLFEKFQEYCSKDKVSLRGKLPKLIVDHLLEIELNETKKTAKIGTVFLKSLDWEKIWLTIEQERHRIWEREFDPSGYRDDLMRIYSEIIKNKPNPVGWVRLEDVYQILKKDIQGRNEGWKKRGRLVAYYKDEFSADLSKLWGAQSKRLIEYPFMELSGIRDPRLAYKVVLSDEQTESYGHMRPKKEDL